MAPQLQQAIHQHQDNTAPEYSKHYRQGYVHLK